MKKNYSLLAFAFLLFLGASAQNLNVVLRATKNYPGLGCSNIWGYVDTTGREYALVGVQTYTSIVDVTNPSVPVEVKQIPDSNSSWHEIRTYKRYAYATTEGGGGLQIIDLRKLPGTNLPYKKWAPTISGTKINNIHALQIDTLKGYIYLYGSNLFAGGAVVADIKTDPWNPIYVGNWSNGSGNARYIHDGFVRNDTMYGGHIYTGYFDVVDFKVKSAPVLLAQQLTPNAFTHNTWLSTNGKVIYTTDEKSGSFVAAFDLSNLGNISELDRIQSNPGSGSIPHNTYVNRVNNNDYAVTSWYKDGFTIVDGGRPGNLVQVGNYDTYSGSGNGFSGVWGVYPYLPSKTVVLSSMDGNLYVLTPTYVRACYLEGTVTDSVTTAAINTANVQIMTTPILDSTKITGAYAVGYHAPNTYVVKYSKSGYITQNRSVVLSAGNVTVLNVKLKPIGTGIGQSIQENSYLNVYPNPSASGFSVDYQFGGELQHASVVLTDLSGRVVELKELSSNEGLVRVGSDVAPGIYLVSIVNGGESTHPVKVIKAN